MKFASERNILIKFRQGLYEDEFINQTSATLLKARKSKANNAFSDIWKQGYEESSPAFDSKIPSHTKKETLICK